MVSVRSADPARLPLLGFGVVVLLGTLAGVATAIGLTVLTPVKVAFVLCGFALLIPTMVLKQPKAYWLFLLVLSIPFDISKWLSAWLVDPHTLVDLYGEPASGTAAIEAYLTDVVLIAMLLQWCVQICLRKENPYFPKIAYLFLIYLAWALLSSLINAQSYYLAIFELFRQVLYFLFFVYLINNVSTISHFRSIACAVFLGLAISTGTVIIFFQIGIGTETAIFASLRDEAFTAANSVKRNTGAIDLTLFGDTDRFFGSRNSGIKRSQGMFRHPAIPASLCGLILPIVLAYLVAARTNRDRVLLLTVFVLGIAGLILTFSRAGAIGLGVGLVVFFAVAGWSGLISRRALVLCVFSVATILIVSIPLLLTYFGTRPGSFSMRFYLFEAALQGYSQHPFLGVGLNNGTAAMRAGRNALKEIGIPMPPTESADNFYLILLTEVGPLGFFLFFLFFGRIVTFALQASKEAETELKPLLAGIVAGLASLATQTLADNPLAGHAIGTTLWLFAGVMIAGARYTQAEARLSPANRHAAPVGLSLATRL